MVARRVSKTFEVDMNKRDIDELIRMLEKHTGAEQSDIDNLRDLAYEGLAAREYVASRKATPFHPLPDNVFKERQK